MALFIVVILKGRGEEEAAELGKSSRRSWGGGKKKSVWFCGTQKPNGEILETAIPFCRHQLFTWKSFFMLWQKLASVDGGGSPLSYQSYDPQTKSQIEVLLP